mgnify:CR=1 FL=1
MPLSCNSQSQPHRHLLWTAKVVKKWETTTFYGIFRTAILLALGMLPPITRDYSSLRLSSA